MDIRDLRPISKDPESPGPIVLLVGTDPDEEDYYGDYSFSTEGLILPRYVEATDYLKGDVYLQSGGGGIANYEDYRDYLFTADYIDGDNDGDKSYLPNNILVDDTKWAWKTPGLSDDEDVDISIHGNQCVLLLIVKFNFQIFFIELITFPAGTSWQKICPSEKRLWCPSRRTLLFGVNFREAPKALLIGANFT